MKNILLVDDDDNMRESLFLILKQAKYHIHMAVNGTEALKFIQNSSFDIVITDIRMPGMDGIELITKIRKLSAAIPLLVITGYHTKKNIIECLDKNTAAYITKPFAPEHFLKEVEKAIQSHPLEDQIKLNGYTHDWFKITITSCEETLFRLKTFFGQYLEKRISKNLLDDILYCFTEIVKNAIEWGNHNNIAKKIDISFQILKEQAIFKIEDHGSGFNVKETLRLIKFPEKMINRRKKQNIRVGGFGIAIISDIMDEVVYNSEGNKITMTKLIQNPMNTALPKNID